VKLFWGNDYDSFVGPTALKEDVFVWTACK